MLLDNLRVIENLDDKREIWHIINKLTPAERTSFLLWSRDKTNSNFAHRPPGIVVKFSPGTNHENAGEAYYDLMLMIAEFYLEVPTVLAELERRGATRLLSPGV